MEFQDMDIVADVGAIYEWLEGQLASAGGDCRACGNCCDFETYGHRLYVTTPELIYFGHFAGPEVRPMQSGVCPYRIENKCTAYSYRFFGCRIFDCRTDAPAQGRLLEATLRRFKDLCNTCNIPYRYLYLKDALNLLHEDKLFLP